MDAPRVAAGSDVSRRAWVEQHMGMPVSIHLRGHGVDSDAAAQAVRNIFQTFQEMDQIFSAYNPQSQLMRLRRGELDLDQCSPRMRESLTMAQDAETATRGAFTTMLPLQGGDFAFDPTGFVKGWTVDLAADHLGELPGVSWCINAGGDMRVGAHRDMARDGDTAIKWNVGIQDPLDKSRLASAVSLSEGAVATSGTAERGAHLYDPVLSTMVGRPGSITVAGPTLLWADIWATALFVGGSATREAFASQPDGYVVVPL